MSIILNGAATDLAKLGGKAKALAALSSADFPIPAWFVLSAEAFYAGLTPAQLAQLEAAETSEAALAIVGRVTVTQVVRDALNQALAALAPDGAKVAVRSSALDEDSREHSFAGQLESFLNVDLADAPARVVDVWRSGFSPRICAYRQEHGLSLPPPAPAVLIQRMVKAQAAGVAFSADPVSGRRSVAVVGAVHGLGDALVSGASNADTYRVGRDGNIVERALQAVEQPVLTDEQARAVAALARRAQEHFGRPQDIEWAMEDGQFYLLQSRSITSLAQMADPDGTFNLWDNSNIIESYGGMTTPLTYSFARRAYEEVYQEFCRLMNVPESTIQANHAVFACMIGLARGRIYYNLLNWYRVLAMLPGFKVNRRFMEQMMGVKESLPETVVAEIGQSTGRQRWVDTWHLLGMIFGLFANFFLLERRKRAFYRRLNDALGAGRPELAGLRGEELAAYYRRLDGQLLKKWDAPLINDFFAMIFYGLLRRLCTAWCGDDAGALQNDLLTGEGGMVSAEPAERVRELARMATVNQEAHPDFVNLLRTGELRAIERAMAEIPVFAQRYQAYLEKFGDRCMNELKLESRTLWDDPLPLLRSIGQLAYHLPIAAANAKSKSDLRLQAEMRVIRALDGKPWRDRIFNWVLKHARNRVRDRENLRFERTRVFGRARQIFRELGRRLYAADLLDDPDDIFCLEVEEILGFAEGTATCTNLRGLAAVRKAEFVRFAQMAPPTERFATYGMVHQGNEFQSLKQAAMGGAGAGALAPSGQDGQCLQGTGCCPGVVRGRARVVTNPLEASLEPGDIVVAEHTDPSWILILPLAAGLLVERGSLLSHAAIVARELGIPAIVALAGVTRWLRDGDWVEFDGSTGVVHKLEE